jgi:hypothetical protein
MSTYEVRDQHGWVYIYEYDSSTEEYTIERIYSDVNTNSGNFCYFPRFFNNIKIDSLYVTPAATAYPIKGFNANNVNSPYYTWSDEGILYTDTHGIQKCLACLPQGFEITSADKSFEIYNGCILDHAVQCSNIQKLYLKVNVSLVGEHAIMCKNLEELWIDNTNIKLHSNFIDTSITTKLKKIYFNGTKAAWNYLVSENSLQLPNGVEVVCAKKLDMRVQINNSLKNVIDAFFVKNDGTLGHIIDFKIVK